MKIAVLVKQVPGSESPLPIQSDQKWVDEGAVAYVMNESDNYALEEALQIKEANGEGEVVAVSLGPIRIQKVIREALAKGADRAIHIQMETAGAVDPLTTAGLFADALKAENFDLIFSGLQSDDVGMGQTGVILGEMMGMATASLAMATEVGDGKIKVKRELEAGWFQWVSLSLPASVTIQSGLNTPRYPSLKGIMGAKRKEIKVVESNAGDGKQSLEKVYVPQSEKQTVMIEGTVDQMVEKLIDTFRNDIKVL
ncbi:MAG: electron transfer flavoprotein subunit beta/FixA family protein [Candidatus Marinimicrobia bacterium]|jgi:electron transfer flavoprotein beta subunit|nr:electron transfer flavoprotein subunit beta/FixA family protein [Candidatus Neomarinimicrobiota bacterium]MBT3675694.1 electron transfer flavoprotein subunit beta/FixA family protein [Candidatus Neomarinimicrobiota bacterium]MBT3763734.1 electron transfer flavoprotein subunit beta/FixA family protein [Candidatus Neomarinimicrobiota bacterium]MBT4068362.1 electron transfer flavoprotein subunit beta/FixA family protein [Candidatus Neomarinimicrobiota bacterium]MBT4271055.1 electron transfer fl